MDRLKRKRGDGRNEPGATGARLKGLRRGGASKMTGTETPGKPRGWNIKQHKTQLYPVISCVG